MTKKRIHLIYGIVLSIMLVIAGLCLIAACIGIYNSADQPFSREAVAAAFGHIAIPVYLCLALMIGGFVLDGFLPGAKSRQPAEKQYGVILARLHGKLVLDNCDRTLRDAISAEQRRRKLHRIITLVLLVMGSAVFLCYGLNSRNFHQSNINSSMIRAMWVFLPCLAVPFAYGLFSAYYGKSSMQKEIALLKEALAQGGQAPDTKTAPQPKSSGKYLLLLRCAILVIGIGILLYGFLAGGTGDVLTKAINICTECVGLG